MVKKVVGYNDQGEKVFEREARVYDQTIANTMFGISIGDVVKAVPVIFLCGIVWANQQSTNEKLSEAMAANTTSIKEIANSNTRTLNALTDYISKMDSYLSSTTGKRFRNGEPQ